MDIIYDSNDGLLDIDEFMDLARVAWKRDFSDETINKFRGAITKTINITARLNSEQQQREHNNNKGGLVGCIRVLTDGYFSTIPEMMVDPQYQHKGTSPLLHNY